MKTAVIYYSYDGNCTFAAEQIAASLKADLVPVQTVDQKKRRGFIKMLWGVSQIMSGKLPPLKPVNFDAAAFDLIILGSPVWASSPAPAMKAFLSQTKFSGKKIALFMCHAGGMGDAMNKFKSMLKDNTIVSEIDFSGLLKNQEKAKQQIEEWVKTLT
jgi:flavodoxin